jgi:hypothetical protein
MDAPAHSQIDIMCEYAFPPSEMPDIIKRYVIHLLTNANKYQHPHMFAQFMCNMTVDFCEANMIYDAQTKQVRLT